MSRAAKKSSAMVAELFLSKLVSEKSDLVVENLCNCVNDTDDEAYTGEAKDTGYESNDILVLKIADDSVNAGYNYAEYEEHENLNEHRECFELSGDGIRLCHFLSP